MNKFENKILNFATALEDAYRDEEDKESIHLPKMELKESELTEDFTAMVYAQWAIYRRITGDEDTDILGFTHILNRLVFQHIAEDGTDKNTNKEKQFPLCPKVNGNSIPRCIALKDKRYCTGNICT